MADPLFQNYTPRISQQPYMSSTGMTPEEEQQLLMMMQADPRFAGTQSVVAGQQPQTKPQPDGTLKKQMSQTVKANLPVSSEQEYKALTQQQQNLMQEMFNQQQLGINQMVQNKRDIEGSRNPLLDTNWAPLAAVFDQGTGGNLAAHSRPQMTEPERQKMLIDLEGAIQKQRNELSQNQVAATKALLDQHMWKQQMQERRHDRWATENLLKRENKVGDAIEKDVLAPMVEDQRNFDNLEANLLSGNSQQISATLPIFSRLISGQKGVLTDKDIALVMPKNMISQVANLQAYFNNNPSAPIPEDFTQNMVKMIAHARSVAAKAYNDRNEQKLSSFKARNSYRDMFGPTGSGTNMFQQARDRVKDFEKPKSPGGKKDINEMTAEEIKAELGQ